MHAVTKVQVYKKVMKHKDLLYYIQYMIVKLSFIPAKKISRLINQYK